MFSTAFAPRARRALFGLSSWLLCSALVAGQPDPFASNNAIYPAPLDWSQGFRPSNFAYPTELVKPSWLEIRPTGPLTPKAAPAYVAAVKKFIEADLSGLVNDPQNWTPQKAGWYDMPWAGQGSPMANGQTDPESGRDALLGSYTGQVLQPNSYPSNPPKKAFQNHAVVFYNEVAARQLGSVWRDPFKPDLSAAQFPEGSMVVKVEAATLDESEWSVLKGSPVSKIFRLPVSLLNETDPNKRKAVITPMRFLQMAVKVKDSQASPITGWVFMAFFYDTRLLGATAWARTNPVGAMWGNDAPLARYPDGLGPKGELQETWISKNLPSFVTDGLGWGGRLAGPLDLGLRHNVVTVSGRRFGDGNPKNPPSLASSACLSCHLSAQYPFASNLYPSPNMTFPPEGGQFLLYDPGSALWAQWFQSLPGSVAMSDKGRRGIVAIDYDMMLTFAVMRANGSAETDAFIRHKMAGH